MTPCEHDWRRGPSDLSGLTEYVCKKCLAMKGAAYDPAVAEWTAADYDADAGRIETAFAPQFKAIEDHIVRTVFNR